jgi:endonuclease-8
MPEGHISHRNARRLEAALAGREIVRVEAPEPRLAPQRIPERMAGDRVERVEALGKHHLLRLASGRVLHSHLSLSGAWRVLPAGAPLRRGGLWLALWTREHVALQLRGPLLRLLEPGEPLPWLAALGPDLLAADLDPAEAMARRLAAIDPSRTIGEALLDQRVVAGIGNIYKSESLFLCGLHPWRTVGSLSEGEARKLGALAARLLADGVRDGGRILTFRRPGAARGPGRSTWVYGRRGLPCRRCGAPVRSRRQGDANRITYWCPGCQPEPGAR